MPIPIVIICRTGGYMSVEYFYCTVCGFEGNDLLVAFSRSVANGDLCKCPNCSAENFVDDEEQGI